MSIVFYLLVLTIALLTSYRLDLKILLTPSHLVLLFRVTPFEFMGKLYGS